MAKSRNYIYGFEGYNIVALGDSYFYSTYNMYLPPNFDDSNGNYIITKDLPYKIDSVPSYSFYRDFISFSPELCSNHPELLTAAKKIYIHPSCGVSRNMVQEKYKKSLNPYLCDAVVIPNPDFDRFFVAEYAIFVNERAELIGKVALNDDHEDSYKKVKAAKIGTKFAELLSCFTILRTQLYSPAHLYEAELIYVGQMLFIPNSQGWAMDILTNRIPTDRIVFEESLQKSLGCDDNKLDLNSMISIVDMLNSSDSDNVSAGLKALSMMDWMHYPNSVKYALNKTDKHKWIYEKAMNSTPVKFMFKSLAPNVRSRRFYPGNYNSEIYEQDYELFKQLKMHYENITQENLLEYMRFLPFINIIQGKLVPNLKK